MVSSVKWWHKPPSAAAAGTVGGGDDSGMISRRAAGMATYVISSGLDGMVFFWLIDGEDAEGRRARRRETPVWSESDTCQICSSPFFWNVKKMWTDMAVGVRQARSRNPSFLSHSSFLIPGLFSLNKYYSWTLRRKATCGFNRPP